MTYARYDFTGLYQTHRRVRPRVEPYKRAEVFARWSFTCAYCDAPAEHLDHITPIAKGGTDVLRNVLPACADCNLSKSNKSLADWALPWLRQPTH